jgi:hypothetical protein
VTAWQLIVGLVLALGGVVWAVAKADLEDPDLYRWLTRKLVYRAALRLPRRERARWRAEAMQNVLDLPGRLPPLLWALDTYVRSGRWGRERGAPARWQALVARGRAVWQRLRSLPEEWARARSKERHPATMARAQVAAEAEPAQAAAAALDATVTLSPASIVSEARMGTPRLSQVNPRLAQVTPKRRTSSSLLSREDIALLARIDAQSEEFLKWLAQQRRDFEIYLYLGPKA